MPRARRVKEVKDGQKERWRCGWSRGQPLVAISLPYRGGWQARAPDLETPSQTVSLPALSAYMFRMATLALALSGCYLQSK